jgi:hypothetical protein
MSEPNGDSQADLHPVQREMLAIEADFERQQAPQGPPIDECIAQLTGFDGDVDEELDPILAAETRRAAVLYRNYYANYSLPTPQAIAAIGFLQGVMFAAAVRNLKERDAAG